MSDYLTIETPEQIPLSLPLAGIGSRFLALAVDTLIQLAVLLGFVILAAVTFSGGLGSLRGKNAWAAALLVLDYFLLMFGYFVLFEAVWNGQTPGKRRMRLRVISDSGRPITTYDSVARNLVRIIDSIPGIYAVGILCALFSSQSKRLGDYVAGTVVVREGPAGQDMGIGWGSSSTHATQIRVSGCDLSRLSTEEFALIEAFLARRGELPAELRNKMARQIAERIEAKLGIPYEPSSTHEALLEGVAAEYRNHAHLAPGQPS